MTEAGDKLTAALARHRASVESSRETARQIAEERASAVEVDTGASSSPTAPVSAPANEGATK